MDSTLKTVWNPSAIPWNPSESTLHSMDSTWNNPGRVKYWENVPKANQEIDYRVYALDEEVERNTSPLSRSPL